MEEACLMGFSEGLEQGKLGTALLQAHFISIAVFFQPVNLKTVQGDIRFAATRTIIGLIG